MAEKRINDPSRRTATAADLKEDNYVLIDGANGTAKAPLTLFGSVLDGGTLTDAAIVTVENNSFSTLRTAEPSLTFKVYCDPGGVPNFAVEITTLVAVTVTVIEILVGNNAAVATELKYSAAGGNSLESGKTYQLTCVGSCWTVAEFVDPAAQQSAPVLTGDLQSRDGGTLSLQTTEETPIGGELGEDVT